MKLTHVVTGTYLLIITLLALWFVVIVTTIRLLLVEG
jgi:hypothetical protein